MRHLRVDRAHGVAPHKPLLLLAVIELIERGQIRQNEIYFSPDLVETIMKYWVKVTDRKPNITLPFFHLKSEEFWHLHPNVGYEKVLDVADRITAISPLREVIAYACLEDDFFALLTDTGDREIIRQPLIYVYLLEFKGGIEDLIAEGQQITEYEQLLISEVEPPFLLQKLTVSTPKEEPIRSTGFRQAIMGLYDYTCAVRPCQWWTCSPWQRSK